MPNTFTRYILNINDEIYNFLSDVNYGMTKLQFHHLSSIVAGLVNVSGDKTISKIARNIADAKDKSCIYKFLSHSKWDEKLIDRNRLNYLNLRFADLIKPNTTGFLIIDDTVNIKESAKKIQGLAYNYSHSEGKSVLSHCIVTSNFVAGNLSIPLQYRPYYNNENCVKLDKPFQSKIDIANKFIQDFNTPINCEKIYCLVDSWYTNTPLIESALKKGYHVIGALKSNRKISPKGVTLQLKEFEKHIVPTALDVVTVKGKDYRVYMYEGSVGTFQNALIAICYEVNGDKVKAPVYLLSTDLELNAKDIIENYLTRWHIETNYKYLKSNLGFDQYRVRGITSIERYYALVFLTINIIEVYRISAESSKVQTIGDAIWQINNMSTKSLVSFIYQSSVANVPIEVVLKTLKVAV